MVYWGKFGNVGPPLAAASKSSCVVAALNVGIGPAKGATAKEGAVERRKQRPVVRGRPQGQHWRPGEGQSDSLRQNGVAMGNRTHSRHNLATRWRRIAWIHLLGIFVNPDTGFNMHRADARNGRIADLLQVGQAE